MARGKSKQQHQKQCPICSKSFVAKSSKAKFCSDYCRQKRFLTDKTLKLENKIVDLSAQTFLQDKIVNENVSTPERIVDEIKNVSEKHDSHTCINDFSYYLQHHHPDFVERLVNENINEVPEMRKQMDGIWLMWSNIKAVAGENT